MPTEIQFSPEIGVLHLHILGKELSIRKRQKNLT